MNYLQALDYLAELNKFGIRLGLTRIKKLLSLMGNPESCFRSIHVTGTNGKGSTTAMLAAILKAADIRCGMYTSPHLLDYTERIVVDGLEIERQHFADVIEYTAHFVNQMVDAGWEHPTEFEVLTAAAFRYFAVIGAEYVVVEVGLGGLWDSTNVIEPSISVITNVALDHTDKCGSQLVDIAAHKAGIIKNGIPLVTAAVGEALEVIEQIAIEKKSNFYALGKNFFCYGIGTWREERSLVLRSDAYGDIEPMPLRLIGEHQLENGAVAAMTAMVLAVKDVRITRAAIRTGLATVTWPGRFEIFDKQPTVVIDGAHNPHGAAALRANLDQIFPGRKIVFLLGILQDKDISGIIAALIRSSDRVVVTVPVSERAGDPRVVAEKITAARSVEITNDIYSGIERAMLLAGEDGVVCIAGSLYLIGEARSLVLKWTDLF